MCSAAVLKAPFLTSIFFIPGHRIHISFCGISFLPWSRPPAPDPRASVPVCCAQAASSYTHQPAFLLIIQKASASPALSLSSPSPPAPQLGNPLTNSSLVQNLCRLFPSGWHGAFEEHCLVQTPVPLKKQEPSTPTLSGGTST